MDKAGNLIGDLYASITNYGSVLVKTGKHTYYRKTTDLLAATASGSVVFLFASCITVFAGLGLAFWLGEVMGSLRLGMFATAGIFLLLLGVFIFAIRPALEPRVKDAILRRLTEDPGDYAQLKHAEAALQSELRNAEIALKKNLDELKSAAGRLGTPGEPAGNGTAGHDTAGVGGRLVSSALKFVLQNYLLPGAGPVKKIILPVVAKAVVNSVLNSNKRKSGLLGRLRSKLSGFI